MSLGGSGLNSANHASHERLNAAFGIKSTYVPYKGTGDMSLAVVGKQIDGAVTYTAFAINNKEPEMKELAAKSGFELINIGVDQMEPFMKDKTKLYTEGAQRLGLGAKK